MTQVRSRSTGGNRPRRGVIGVAIAAALGLMVPATAPPPAAEAAAVAFTILHTNDFHGQLEPSGSNPGAARVAQKIQDIRAAVGDSSVLLLDAGDMMQGSLLSNIGKGLPTIDYYRTIGYDAATFGNHEFDWGQAVLDDRIAQAEAAPTADEQPMRMVAANITLKDAGGACTWTPFRPSVTPYEVFTVSGVKVGVIGVASVETPSITIASATEGLCFRDPAESILHYYTALDAAAQVLVVLSHNGYADGGYGYGFDVYGDQTLARKLNDAGKPVDLIIGGHSHTNLSAATVVGGTTVVQAYYNGRALGRATVGYDGTHTSVDWTKVAVGTTDQQYAPIQSVVSSYATDPAYQALVNQPIGYSQVDLVRNYNDDAMMGDFIGDAIMGSLNTDPVKANDVDLVLGNPGGLRSDWCDKEGPPGTFVWSSDPADCSVQGLWAHPPMLLTFGQMFTILPFGNATVVGTMTGAQILDVLHQSATLFKGALQPAGLRYSFFRYADALPGPQPYAWGSYDIQVYDRATHGWVALDPAKSYRVATNEFLAPAGGDGFSAFKYMADITYWGDQLDAVNAYVATHYTELAPYRGPDGDGTLDGRITRTGDGDDTYETREMVPVTILHHNDSHGRLLRSGSSPGYSQLVTLITQERAHNPSRTLLVNAGDTLQGDLLSYYFRTAGLGHSADGSTLPDEVAIPPLVKAFNSVGYDAVTLGNHDFDFGSTVLTTLTKATFPVLQANVADSGAYGLAGIPVEPYVEKSVGPEGIKVAILGLGNHRVPQMQLPSSIPGLSFTDPIEVGSQLAPVLQGRNDAVVALTHIGFTAVPGNTELDSRVDTLLAAGAPGLDAVIGGHSHTSPTSGAGEYKYLPAQVPGPGGRPVLVTQAYRYNTFLGEVVLGMRPASGGYEVASAAGRSLAVNATTDPTVENPGIVSLAQPYVERLNAYTSRGIGSTTTPIDALAAFTEETNSANLQADAAVWKLEQMSVPVDIHLSGAVANRRIADSATPASPYPLTVTDMVTAIPYDNSLVVMGMNGPQLKAVLERGYRNYYFYKYVPGYGGYSYYPTCMLDTDAGSRILYRDTYPAPPDGNNVAGLLIAGTPVDLTDPSTFYRVSTVSYLALGACNFSDSGASLWPLSQVVADTQVYIRDAVIDYVDAQSTPISPAVEGRLAFTAPAAPVVQAPSIAPEPSTAGQAASVSAGFTASSDHGTPTCTIDHGDGTGSVAGVAVGATCVGPAHTFSAAGTYSVTVTVRDGLAQRGSATASHSVLSAPPGPTPPPPSVVTSTTSATVSFKSTTSTKLTSTVKRKLRALVAQVPATALTVATTSVGVVRAKGATKKDRARALKRARAVRAYLIKIGLSGPVVASNDARTTSSKAKARRSVIVTITFTTPAG